MKARFSTDSKRCSVKRRVVGGKRVGYKEWLSEDTLKLGSLCAGRWMEKVEERGISGYR